MHMIILQLLALSFRIQLLRCQALQQEMFSTLFLILTTLFPLTLQLDQFFTRGSFNVGAQRMHYGTNRVAISRNTDFSIFVYSAGSSTIYRSLPGTHKAEIKALAFDSSGIKLASAGSDSLVNIFSLTVPSFDCQFTGIHGVVQELLWLSDNIRLVGVTNAGYAYVWNATGCFSLARRTFPGQTFKSVLERSAGNQIWIANYESTIYRLNYDLTDSAPSFTVGTSRLVSVFQIPGTTYSGVCTEKAFYLYNAVSLVHTRNYLASPTTRCRVSKKFTQYTGWTQGYFIAAASGYQQLFTVWKLELASPYTWLIRTQVDDNRHLGTKPHTVELNYYKLDDIQTISSSSSSRYVHSRFIDTTTTICDTGTRASTRVYGSAKCTLCVDIIDNAACYSCITDFACSICYPNHYLDSPSGNCIRCTQGCYNCTSSTTCTACHADLALISGNCVACNLTNCVNCFFSSSTFLCSACFRGYYLVQSKGCQPCSKQMQNCLQCSSSTSCTLCQPNFKRLSTGNGCEPCSLYMEGCVDCITNSFCDSCNLTTHPYYEYQSTTARKCQKDCNYKCLTCNFYHDHCISCDSNRTSAVLNSTLGTNTCNCKSGYLEDPNSNKACRICSQLVAQCSVCLNTTYCTTCNAGLFFNPTATGYRSCLACNYSCATCSGNYYDCSSCSGANNRILQSNRCSCTSIQYYQVALSPICLQCSTSITNCLTCYNSSFCLTCTLGNYLNVVSAGNRNCQVCGSRCSTCQNSANACKSCKISQNRQLNTAASTCDCLYGYLNVLGNDVCQKCSDHLNSCFSCTNTTVCTNCQNNNFFELDIASGKRICSLCRPPCVTCNTWSTKCSSCSPTANRNLNTATDTCDCISGYTQSGGYCLNCNSTFQKCIDCNITHCRGCQPGYALSANQLQCLDCKQLLVGCLDCMNGFCSRCDTTKNFVLSLTKCTCADGYYFDHKHQTCSQYAMGLVIRRQFTLQTLVTQDLFNQNNIMITTNFAANKVKFPLGLENSFQIYLNGIQLSSFQFTGYQTEQYNLIINYTSDLAISRAQITLQFLKNRIYDEDQYQPKVSLLTQTFYKNLYGNNSNSTAAHDIQGFTSIIENYINLGIRYSAAFFALLGSMDVMILLISAYHIFPLYALLQLSIPGQLHQVLKSMLKIHQDSLFYFPYSERLYQEDNFNQNSLLAYHGLNNSFLNQKHIDLIFFALVIIVYGFLGKWFLDCMHKGSKYKIWKGKFQERRYSTVILTALSLMVSFIASNAFNYFGRSKSPGFNHNLLVTQPLVSSYLTLGCAVLITSIFFGLILFHINAIGLCRLKQNVKTEDCYMGMSKIDARCDHYVLSQLLYWLFAPLAILYLNSLAFLIISLTLLFWNLSFYRHWILFPNKVVYFCRLFSQVGLFLFNAIFIVYYVSQAYTPVDISILSILGYFGLACLAVNLGLNLILGVTFIVQAIIRLCKTNNSLIQQLAKENAEKKKSLAQVKDLRGKANVLSTKIIANPVQTDQDDNRQMNSRVNLAKNIFTRNRKLLVDK